MRSKAEEQAEEQEEGQQEGQEEEQKEGQVEGQEAAAEVVEEEKEEKEQQEEWAMEERAVPAQRARGGGRASFSTIQTPGVVSIVTVEGGEGELRKK